MLSEKNDIFLGFENWDFTELENINENNIEIDFFQGVNCLGHNQWGFHVTGYDKCNLTEFELIKTGSFSCTQNVIKNI